MLATATSAHPGVVLADCYTTIEHRTGLLWPVGIPPGARRRSRLRKMLKAALVRLVNLRS
jgi:hypothetical protein